MRVLIQHRAHLLYLTEDGHWTGNLQTARCFDSSIAALDRCLHGGLGDVRILLKFSEARYDVALDAPSR